MDGSWAFRIILVNTIILLIAVGTAGMFGFWVSDREAPVDVIRIQVLPPMPAPGETMKAQHTIIRKRRCMIKLQQIVFDSQDMRINAPVEEYLVGPGELGEQRLVTTLPLPATTSAGGAKYRAIRAYYCNPIQKWFDWPILIIGPDVDFMVREATSPSPVYDLPLRTPERPSAAPPP